MARAMNKLIPRVAGGVAAALMTVGLTYAQSDVLTSSLFAKDAGLKWERTEAPAETYITG